MYNCGQSVIDLLWKNYHQIVKIQFEGTEEEILLTEKDIMQGSLVIDRYTVSGSKIEIGSAIASELRFQLNNNDGRFDDVTFEGAELFVQIGIKKWDASEWEHAVTHWIPCGYFTVDTPPRTLSKITVSALDRMMYFDKPVNPSLLTFPMTVEELAVRVCNICNVTLDTTFTGYPNRNYSIPELPNEFDLTYRTLIQWIAEITGTCAYVDWDGHLKFEWYKTSDFPIEPTARYKSDMFENDITITGIYFQTSDDTEYVAGTKSYAVDISDNGLIQSNYQNIVDAIYVKIGGFSYRPYQANIKPSPFLYPMDMVKYEDKNGVIHDTIISHVTFTMNGVTSISAPGLTEQTNTYAAPKGMTKRQMQILQALEDEFNAELDSTQQATLELNQVIANSLGLHRTIITHDDGSKSFYFHNALTIADSAIIYTFVAGGVAWTNDWNDGDPVWHYGITRDGNAILHMLDVYELTADHLQAGSVTAQKINLDYKTSVQNDINQVRLDTESAIQQTDTTLRTLIAETAEDLESGLTNDYRTEINQGINSVEVDISAIESRVTNTENDLNDYKETQSTYFNFSQQGLKIGKQVNEDESPYAIVIDNESMKFQENGSVVAYVQYNKLHINAVEAVSRLSVGAAADGGYFDFISTIYGMGVKWRAVQQPNTLNAMVLRSASRHTDVDVYEALTDNEDGIFSIGD